MQAEWAGQQALCNAAALPGVNCNTGNSIQVCNDVQTFFCGSSGGNITIPAGTSCQTLITTGLTQAQIDAATLVIKANLNAQVIAAFCGYLCPISLSFQGAGGTQVTVDVHNVGAVVFDSSTFQMCHLDGSNCFNSVQPTVNPGATVTVISVASAFFQANGFQVRYKGGVIFAIAGGSGFDRLVTVVAGC